MLETIADSWPIAAIACFFLWGVSVVVIAMIFSHRNTRRDEIQFHRELELDRLKRQFTAIEHKPARD